MLQGYVAQRTLRRRHNRKVKTSMSHRGSATQVAQLGSAVCKYLASLQRCGQGPASRHFGHAGLLIPHGRAPQTCRRSPAGHAGARGGATGLCYIAHILSACVEFTHAAEAALGTQHALKHSSTRPTHRAPHRARHVCSPCACPSGDSPSTLLAKRQGRARRNGSQASPTYVSTAQQSYTFVRVGVPAGQDANN